MKSCKAVAYLVEVRKLNARANDNLLFKNFNGAVSLRDALVGILGKYPKYMNFAMYERLFKIDFKPTPSGPLVGRIFSGQYGQAGEIVDAATGATTYSKKIGEALPDPFYFHIAVPDKEKRGIVCLQQSGLSGVKGLFETAVVGVFSTLYPDYRLHIRQLTVADALSDMLKDGLVEEVIVEKHEIPADIADRFGGQKKAYPGKFVYSIQPKTGFLHGGIFKKDGLIAYAKGEKKLEDVFEFDDFGFDVVKTKIRIGDDIRTINLTKPDLINSSFDITDDVVYGADGHPTTASLASEFHKIVEGLAKKGGISL